MPQYFDAEPTVASQQRTVPLLLPDVDLTLTTDRGVFSADRVDGGSKLLLLEGPAPTPEDRVLVDVGAGYGPIACTLALRNPQATVYAVEVNQRARELCEVNATSNGLKNLIIVTPEEFPDGLAIDRIWSNPPIRVGKAVLHDILRVWLSRLTPAGSAHLVVQKHLGADSLHRWLETEGYRVERRLSKKAFRLLDVTRDAPDREGSAP